MDKEERPAHERTESKKERRMEGEKKPSNGLKSNKKPASRMMMSTKGKGAAKY